MLFDFLLSVLCTWAFFFSISCWFFFKLIYCLVCFWKHALESRVRNVNFLSFGLLWIKNGLYMKFYTDWLVWIFFAYLLQRCHGLSEYSEDEFCSGVFDEVSDHVTDSNDYFFSAGICASASLATSVAAIIVALFSFCCKATYVFVTAGILQLFSGESTKKKISKLGQCVLFPQVHLASNLSHNKQTHFVLE